MGGACVRECEVRVAWNCGCSWGAVEWGGGCVFVSVYVCMCVHVYTCI